MSFTSPLFFVFIFPVLLAVALLKGRSRVYFLIFASYLFYAAAFPPYVFLLFFSTFVDFNVGKRLANENNQKLRNVLLGVSLCSNLGLLLGFKYVNFFVDNVNVVLSQLGRGVWGVPDVLLPVGISFYTFQTLGYIIDIYRRKIEPADRFSDFALFISFFPPLVAGPIVRAKDFLPQIERAKPFVEKKTLDGLQLVLIGFFKKVVVADNAAFFVNETYSYELGGAALFCVGVFFAVQIYADFSAYTDIARGLSKIMGFDLPENFHWPYFSTSMRDFWRRWHISLSFWLRDYLYISLGGNRCGRFRSAFNSMITWFICGLWHGAAWNFILWGLYHGVLVTIEQVASKSRIGAWASVVPVVLKSLATFTLVVIGWVIFRAQSGAQAVYDVTKILKVWEVGYLSGLEAFMGLPLLWLSIHSNKYA